LLCTPTKGDRCWMEQGRATPLIPCSCAQCGREFGLSRRVDVSDEVCCPRCNDGMASRMPEQSPAEQLWVSTLHTDVPRAIPRPGKVAERQRCVACGALGPHKCPVQCTPAYDSPQDRALVGFVDRGLRRYHPETKSEHHTQGLTSGASRLKEQDLAVLKVRLAKSALAHGRIAGELVWQGTPFASPLAASPAASVRELQTKQVVHAAAVNELPVREASIVGEPNLRLQRWEERRAAQVARLNSRS